MPLGRRPDLPATSHLGDHGRATIGLKAVLAIVFATALTGAAAFTGILPTIRAQALSAADCWYKLDTPCPFLGLDVWQLVWLFPLFIVSVPVGLILGIVVWPVWRRREAGRAGLARL